MNLPAPQHRPTVATNRASSPVLWPGTAQILVAQGLLLIRLSVMSRDIGDARVGRSVSCALESFDAVGGGDQLPFGIDRRESSAHEPVDAPESTSPWVTSWIGSEYRMTRPVTDISRMNGSANMPE